MKFFPIGYISRYSLFLILFLLQGCENNNSVTIPGYIDADYLYISSSYSGTLESLLVNRGQMVEKNQQLFVIDPQPETDAVIIANARLSQAASDLERTKTDYILQKKLFTRSKQLYHQDVITKEEFEISQSKYSSAKAQLDAITANMQALKAELHKSEWILKQKTYYSPTKALVYDSYYTVNELVQPNNPILSLLKNDSIKFVFYSPESLLKSLKLNQTVTIRFDGSPISIKAKVIYISPNAEYNPPVIYSSESRTKLTFRVEAKPIDVDSLKELHPGQPVSVIINM
ncbi:HlyD family secretion protein [Legionella waltersii]|uniref:Hemolysin D n=1 Tax=Legionella waltersii TaxID=66969 RepID=A0A0W1AP46_9GAMM|nr:HlyD family efflux transporter periplasmic adaptor subunit [Legionella waltersii]KTD83100.1 hemolysin D [Legionella waltersii]SNU96665.1 hemolysin D [Legionella waltersii]